MSNSEIIPFTTGDIAINNQILTLYTSLMEQMQEFRFQDYGVDDLTTYGVYPSYSEQKLKVLFIGREARGLSGHNYIEMLYKAYKLNDVGGIHLNQAAFHRRMLKVAHFLNNPDILVDELPTATHIAETFGTSFGCSFAFMNLSKFSNESESWSTRWDLLDASNPDNHFTRRFVEIVAPDLIVSMGIRDRLQKIFDFKEIGNIGSAVLFSLTAGEREIDWIDGYHYSAPNISDLENVIDPIFRYLNRKKGI